MIDIDFIPPDSQWNDQAMQWHLFLVIGRWCSLVPNQKYSEDR